jgi:hypothetical protein
MAYSCRHSLFALFLECPANVTPEFAPGALLRQKARAHLFSPFQCGYVPDILEDKQQSIADISVTVSSNEAQRILN